MDKISFTIMAAGLSMIPTILILTAIGLSFGLATLCGFLLSIIILIPVIKQYRRVK